MCQNYKIDLLSRICQNDVHKVVRVAVEVFYSLLAAYFLLIQGLSKIEKSVEQTP